VPEIAARSHIEVMLPVIQQALDEAEMTWKDIDAIAVTQGPGLLGSLLIGVLTARTLAWSLNKPLFAVHHILGHIYANWVTAATSPSLLTMQFPNAQPEFPVLALIVSGGHTQLMLATNHTNWHVVGRTQDDAVGEAFDKVAKVLGLPYPGGPSVAAAAQDGNPSKFPLPTAKMAAPYDFSFSGLKTAVLRAVQKECGVPFDFPSFKLAELLTEEQVHDFAASFQANAVRTLAEKTKKAYDEFLPKSVIIGGGVASSLPLRAALKEILQLEITYAPPLLCTDNAAMIAARAYFQSQLEQAVDPHHLETKPSWPL
jgi:N6-L-threonylcarbamoyladenine synthase